MPLYLPLRKQDELIWRNALSLSTHGHDLGYESEANSPGMLSLVRDCRFLIVGSRLFDRIALT